MTDRDPLEAFCRLLLLTDLERELWVDNRIVGVPLSTLALREGVSKQAISLRVNTAQRKLEGHARKAAA